MVAELLGLLTFERPARLLPLLRTVNEQMLTGLLISDSKINEEDSFLILAHLCKTV